MMREETVLMRDVEVTAIPYGDKITLTSGSPVIISQALGGSFTLVTMQGYMVRLDGGDADAIGKEPQKGPSDEDAKNKTCLLYTSPSPRDLSTSRMPSSA